MKIRVDKIPEAGQDVEVKFEPSEMDMNFHGYDLHEAVTFAGHISKSGDDVYVDGALRGVVTSECSRCLESFTMPINMAMRVVYAPERERATREEDMPIEPEKDISFYKEDVIDLLHEVKELLLVNLPIKPICKSECKGFCPQCGAALNVAACGCELKQEPSPFEKLKDLKGKFKEK